MSSVPIRSITPHFKRISAKTVWSFVRVESTDGHIGWGEATINGQAAAIAEEVRRQGTALAGSSIAVGPRLNPLATGKLGWAVVSAIDQGLWDIAAMRENLPLAKQLGSTASETVLLYANINRGTTDRSPAGFAASAAAALAAGVLAIKIAPFDDLTPELADCAQGSALIRAGLDRIGAILDVLGSKARLMVDCHWRFTESTAASTLREAARMGIVWFECPLPETVGNILAVRRLRSIANAVGVRLAGLEECSLLESFLPWAEAYDVMMPDVKYAGGLAETLRIAEALQKRGVGFSLHNPTGSVCHAVSLHVSAVCSTGYPLEMQWDETDQLFDLPDVALPRPRAGRSALPVGAGHGAVLSLGAVSDAPS